MSLRFSAAILLFLLFSTVSPASAQIGDPVLNRTYADAMQHYRAGELTEAISAIDSIFAKEADFWIAYSTYWDLLKAESGPGRMVDHANETIDRMARIPSSFRTKEYYQCILDGCSRTKRAADFQKYGEELLGRYPRDVLSQRTVLEMARDAADPVKAVSYYQHYLNEFAFNAAWCLGSARNIFSLVRTHPDKFTPEQLKQSAEQLMKECRTIKDPKNAPADYLACLDTVVAGTCDAELWDACSDYVKQGREFQAQIASQTGKNPGRRPVLDGASMMMLHAKGNVDECIQLADDMMPPVGSPTRFPLNGVLRNEGFFRSIFANSLDSVGRIEDARTQWAAAAFTDAKFIPALMAFHAKHPLSEVDHAQFDFAMRDTLAQSLPSMGNDQSELTKEEAAPFDLEMMREKGKKLSLASLKGKNVIITFWATWCAPCKWLMADLQRLHEDFERRGDVEILAINIDEDRAKAMKFLEGQDWPFQLLYSNERMNAEYQALAVPQFMLIDGNGYIRSMHRGYGPNMGDRLRRILIDLMARIRLETCFPKADMLSSAE